MSTKYPILVPDWDEKHPADLAICERCEHEFVWDPSEGDPYDLCARCGQVDSTRPGGVCAGQIVFKFNMVDSCPGCGKLGYDAQKVDGACSRRCALQAEYAASLTTREATA